ncbi:MAG TPA: hypothetical protein VGG67_12510 [Steroidobacteraceae bacterium]
MDRATDRIERHLDHERQALRSNLAELEHRVRSVVDWRRQFRGNTAGFLGCACASGLLIGMMTARRAQDPSGREYSTSPGDKPATPYADHRRRELSLAWRTIESALIGLAAAKLKDTLGQLLPGFREQLVRRKGDG